ncbi:glutamine--fructose-6-phosphate transaminase (isomerizing) [Tetragenococcus koreensis]|uniref:Glutamine--fructose-6-phosphate aminotransferase [isomerizing] n=1 Tax=Tetragenococcus koreensis TaxID=290335 RepID=A0AAN4ZQF7_9ENTE|nr:glutamine--fructose-6-phosphate transaminase (isomerizing) [Tetragenococcus koreensis]MCF1584321.1 glutamine--fructose-6-phosphate transaminase (isomerizing) [Tetragenococcus koreensis]MCF1613870.1 glutamine--fructose-6-phosphate transaminase (isomerizing) [Tetragenococcus koreensis]MCF1616062.1 glutamine--fructose-6-phosphate transaminase (isomerizing) [Tetragenococcus koreensis]MCF1618586.1 glutamine--fructose-6-phosphate transaminase (isomerizing) [Tetragenococcus koreensis]MCF1621127.1 
MCGIVGIVGKDHAEQIIINGLQRLEYRGYDSAGLFVSDEKQEYLIKSQGRIKNLQEKVANDVNGTIGIGHTRWATHGKPSEENAHPHTSQNGKLVLVHNGVIENFEELSQKYLAGEIFYGQTDTEIVVNLIASFMENDGLSTKAAFKKAITVIRGSYAFALVNKDEPETIYVAKNKSPLLIGLGTDFNVIASDALAVLDQTHEFVEIADNELVTVTADKVIIENQDGETIQRDSYEAQLDASDIEKGTYPFYMLKEIDEQPTVMRKLTQEYRDDQGNVNIDQELVKEVADSDRIYIVACGTSYNAGWAAKSLIETVTQIPVEVQLSSEFGYNMPLLSKKPFFIFLTQSGETADSRQVLVQTNRLGFPSLTITNVAGSTLSREAKYTLLLHAGPEIAVASTKAYTAQIAMLAILTQAVGEIKDKKANASFDAFHELSIAAAGMEAMVDEKDYLANLVEQYLSTTRNAFYIGRGNDYHVASEAALKLKEISYVQAEGFAAGELKHGTIALIEEGTPVLGIITDDKTGPHTRGNLKEVESRGANTIVIVSEDLAREGDQVVLPMVHPLLTSLVSVVPTQLIAYYASMQRGYDVDKPRNLAKSVTVE